MTRTGGRPLTSIVGERVDASLAELTPDTLTKRGAVQMLANARHLVKDARDAAGDGSVGGVVFTGHRTKRLIKKAELQLGVR